MATATAAVNDPIYARELIGSATALDLAEDPIWRALVHYEPRPFGGHKSTADSPTFFLAEDGKTDPAAELDATLAAFFDDPVIESESVQHPQCRFRARYLWLAERLGFDPGRLRVEPCARFVWWLGQMRPRGVTLVFAAAYLNNPASMFGHTFLRLDRGNTTDLLAYTVNFSAVPTSNNPLIYTVAGLAGGFDGTYSTLPYYLKVKEYAGLEHRDLWEYALDLQAAEIDRLAAHLWELGNVAFDYYYLDENCSYQLLSLLEVARPSLALGPRFPLYAIPVDTVRAVIDAGLVKDRRFRPSRYRVMNARRAMLDGDEASLAKDLAEGHTSTTALAGLEVGRRAAILDAALEKLTYDEGDEPEPELEARQSRLLLTRGRLRTPSSSLSLEPGPPPEAAHGTALIGMGAGLGEHGGFLRVESRFALHDRMANPTGYVAGSQIEFLRLGLRVPIAADQRARPELDQVRVIDIVSLTPFDRWAPKLSWRVGTGLWPQRDGGCVGTRCWSYGVAGGPGLATDFGTEERLLLYAFFDLQIALGPVFRDGYRIGAGGTAGLSVALVPRWRWLAEAGYLFPVLGDPYALAPRRLQLSTALDLADDVELRIEAIANRGDREVRGALYFYF